MNLYESKEKENTKRFFFLSHREFYLVKDINVGELEWESELF